MFKKGDTVKLIRHEKSYEVLVTGCKSARGNFAGVIVRSEYDESEFYGSLTVGSYDNDFNISEFQLVG